MVKASRCRRALWKFFFRFAATPALPLVGRRKKAPPAQAPASPWPIALRTYDLCQAHRTATLCYISAPSSLEWCKVIRLFRSGALVIINFTSSIIHSFYLPTYLLPINPLPSYVPTINLLTESNHRKQFLSKFHGSFCKSCLLDVCRVFSCKIVREAFFYTARFWIRPWRINYVSFH